LEKLISHLKFRLRCGYEINCPYTNCNRQHSLVGSFSSQLTRYHKGLRISNKQTVCPNDIQVEFINCDETGATESNKDCNQSTFNSSDGQIGHGPCNATPDLEEITKQFVLCYIFLEYKQLVLANTFDSII